MGDEVATRPAELVHEVPFSVLARGAVFCMGMVALVVPAYELWGGVWPPTATTPFFAFMIAASAGLGLIAVYAAVFSAKVTLVARRGELRVHEVFLWKKRWRTIPSAEIEAVQVRKLTDSDGPDQWEVQIKLEAGKTFHSRRFQTEAPARKLEEELQWFLLA